MQKIQAGYWLGRLGFRGLFVLIGGVFAAAFLAVSAPYLLSRWLSMQGAAEHLEAIRQTAATRELIRDLQRRRRDVFLVGAGDVVANAENGRNLQATVAFAGADETLRSLLAMSPEDAAGRKRMQWFATFGEQIDRLQSQVGDRLGSGTARGNDSQQAVATVWVRDLPLLRESLARLDVLAGLAAREGMVADKFRPELSASIAVASHALESTRRELAPYAARGRELAGLNEQVAALAGQFELTRTLAYEIGRAHV